MIFLKQAYFECVIPKKNRNAFYHLVAGRDLFGFILVRRWGRIGTKGQPRLKSRFNTREEMMLEFKQVIKKRLAHQYELTNPPGGSWS